MSAVPLVSLLLLVPPAAPADPVDPAPKPPPVPVVKLAPQATGPAPRALRYHLLPAEAELQPGNGAPLWLRAGQAARDASKRFNYDWIAMPLKDLPKQEIRDCLASYGPALRLAEQAAHRKSCDWDTPPFTLENWDFPIAELQMYRELAQLLSIRARLALSTGDFDTAVQSLRIGLALARHLGEGETVVQSLVSIAIAAVMFGIVEEWMQVPGSPNLYWSLTALPVPFIDVRRAMEVEFDNLGKAVPEFRGIREQPLRDPAQSQAMVARLSKVVGAYTNGGVRDTDIRFAVALLAAKVYPDARQSLLAAGYNTERLDAMSPLQVVLIAWLDENDRFRDDVLKVMSLPPWQAKGILNNVDRGIREMKARYDNPLLTLLFPAIHKVYDARLRLERTVASLRCGEALRLHAAAHDGKAPIRLVDVTGVPMPTDPVTGKGFDGWYTSKDGHGVLEVPGMPSQSPQTGRRFEIGTDHR
jgi:hypothetical protein